jgi:hypothetical protein
MFEADDEVKVSVQILLDERPQTLSRKEHNEDARGMTTIYRGIGKNKTVIYSFL